jgi:A/G-specific adenine glycosylase
MPSPDPLTRSEKLKLTRLARDLVAWSRASGREFPWRSPRTTTYEKIAVEVLLQRTTASAVATFYEQFFARFPGWGSLAAATAADLEQFLKPLGLRRRRAASLLGLARYASENDGRFPSDPAEHVSIPAVGQYVSNAILMFQHGKAVPLVDVNMARVIERVVRPRRLADIRYDPWLQDAARWFVKGGQPAEANWAILDFAALVCKARRPLCETCPVNRYCSYFRSITARLGSNNSPPPAERR